MVKKQMFEAADPTGSGGARPPSRHEAQAQHAEAAVGQRLDKARAAHRGYFRWRQLSRLALAAFGLLAIVFLVWALPWLPKGLHTNDYTPQLAFTVYLVMGVAGAAVFALIFQELARRDRESLMVWGTVFDETSGLHNRTYLFDRLSLECEQAARSGGVFSVIALQIRPGNSSSRSAPSLPPSALQDIGTLLDCLTHPSDLVALLSGAELAVLAVGVDRNDRATLQERLRGAVAAALPRLLKEPAPVSVRGGGATYGEESTDPGTLIQAARTAAVLAPRGPAQAA